MYLRELPDPLLTYELYDCWLASSTVSNNNGRLLCFQRVLELLPEGNKLILYTLLKLWVEIDRHNDKNKMTSLNLSIIFAPSLLKCRLDTAQQILTDAKPANETIYYMINHVDEMFGLTNNKINDKDIKEKLSVEERSNFMSTLRKGTIRLANTQLEKEVFGTPVQSNPQQRGSVMDLFNPDGTQALPSTDTGLIKAKSSDSIPTVTPRYKELPTPVRNKKRSATIAPRQAIYTKEDFDQAESPNSSPPIRAPPRPSRPLPLEKRPEKPEIKPQNKFYPVKLPLNTANSLNSRHKKIDPFELANAYDQHTEENISPSMSLLVEDTDHTTVEESDHTTVEEMTDAELLEIIKQNDNNDQIDEALNEPEPLEEISDAELLSLLMAGQLDDVTAYLKSLPSALAQQKKRRIKTFIK